MQPNQGKDKNINKSKNKNKKKLKMLINSLNEFICETEKQLQDVNKFIYNKYNKDIAETIKQITNDKHKLRENNKILEQIQKLGKEYFRYFNINQDELLSFIDKGSIPQNGIIIQPEQDQDFTHIVISINNEDGNLNYAHFGKYINKLISDTQIYWRFLRIQKRIQAHTNEQVIQKLQHHLNTLKEINQQMQCTTEVDPEQTYIKEETPLIDQLQQTIYDLSRQKIKQNKNLLTKLEISYNDQLNQLIENASKEKNKQLLLKDKQLLVKIIYFIIVTYTKSGYMPINRALTSSNPHELIGMRMVLQILLHNHKKLWVGQKNKYKTLYRSVPINERLVSKFYKQGNILYFRSMTSTNSKPWQETEIWYNENQQPEDVLVLFKIQIQDSQNSLGFQSSIDIQRISYFGLNQTKETNSAIQYQVLFFPFQFFKVQLVSQIFEHENGCKCIQIWLKQLPNKQLISKIQQQLHVDNAQSINQISNQRLLQISAKISDLNKILQANIIKNQILQKEITEKQTIYKDGSSKVITKKSNRENFLLKNDQIKCRTNKNKSKTRLYKQSIRNLNKLIDQSNEVVQQVLNKLQQQNKKNKEKRSNSQNVESEKL